MTLIPPSWVGIRPEANSGALLQITPAAGVLLGTRFGPCICTHAFGAINGASEPAVLMEVIVGRTLPAGGCVRVPDPVKVNVCLDVLVTVRVAEPVAPANTPVPPVTLEGKVYEFWFRSDIEKKTMKESLALRVNVAVPCAVNPSVVLRVVLMVTLPKGVTLPVAVAEIVPTAVVPVVRLMLVSEMAVGV